MKILIALAGALALSLPAFAADNACMAAAAQKKLAGAAENAFMHKCERDKCEAAMDRKLYGAAKAASMKKCMADRLKPFCETKAKDKKLYGAARTSFIGKCQSD
jgi:hypothetical protein